MDHRLGDSVTRVASWGPADSIAATLITIIAGALRLITLARPTDYMFDEIYYAKDACWYLHDSASVCETDHEITYVHPPLAKWLIALGIRLYGYNTFGWRIMAALVGTATVLLLYILARKLLGSTVAASVASGLLAIDFLHFVQSRIAMLDIFVPFFGLASLVCLVYDRAALLDGRRGRILARPWRAGAGAFAAAAAASKWSGFFFLGIAIVLTILWEIAARRRREGLPSLRMEAIPTILYLKLLPIALYAATFVGRVDGKMLAAPWATGSWLRALWDLHFVIVKFHRTLGTHHSYESPGWTWMLLKRPVAYFFDKTANGEYKEILALGSPFVWWMSILALTVVFAVVLRRRDPFGPEVFIAMGFVLTYGFWLLPSERPSVFLFYMLPVVPFMCLALGYVARWLGTSWEARTAVALFGVCSIAIFMYYRPILVASAIPQRDWDRRMWIFDDRTPLAFGPVTVAKTPLPLVECDKVAAEPTSTTAIETKSKKRTGTAAADDEDDGDDLPPKGWCWI